MFSSRPTFKPDKCKVQLKMLISRIKLHLSKQTNLAKAERRVVAGLLKDNKEHSARIKVEQIIRADFKLESLEMINNYTELLISRFQILTVSPELKPEIAEAVTALVYAGYLLGTEIPELKELFNMFAVKYGKEYVQEVITKKDELLAHRFNKVLTSSQVPDHTVIIAYLTEIAKSYGVEYVPTLASEPPLHISATTGIALPDPGQPMGAPPQPIDPSTIPGATPANPVVGTVPVAAGMPMGTALAGGGMHQFDNSPPGATPVYPTASVPPPPGSFTVSLTKRHPNGFGLTLDASNMVTGLKTADAEAKVAVGDICVAFNGVPVTAEKPVKMLAIDCNEGQEAAFTLLRKTAAPPASAAPEAGGLYSPQNLGGLPTAMAGPSAPPPDTTPAMPPTAPPTAPPVYPTPSAPPSAEEDPDDMLAKRLAALKR